MSGKKPQPIESERTLAAEAGLPDSWHPIDAPAIVPGALPNPNARSNYLAGQLNTTLQHPSVLLDQAKQPSQIPQLPLMPLLASAVTNAAVQSVAKVISQQSPTDLGALTTIFSDDGSISITNPSATSTDLRVANVANVKHFGNPLTGAGKQNYAGGMTANSNILTLRLGTQSNPAAPISGGQLFTAQDVGKSILVSGPAGGAGAAQIKNLWSTIVSVQSPTQATLADAAPATGIATNFSAGVYWYDPAADDTAAIQAAIDACDNTNQYSSVYLPAGVYLRTGTLTNSLNMKEFYGDGMQRTVILTKGPSVQTKAVNFTDQVDFKMHDMTWHGPGIDETFGGHLVFNLFVESVLRNLHFENVEIRHCAYDGMQMTVPILTTFKNCLFTYNAGHGLNLNTAVACTFDSCYFLTSFLSGVNMTGCAALAFNACANESNGIGYYANGGTWGVSFNGCDAEYQTQRASKVPASFPVVTVSAGGSVTTGTYLFRYSWVRQVTNNSTPVESLPSPESSPVVVTSGNQTISFTIPTAPTDVPSVTRANIYATSGAAGSEVLIQTVVLNPSAPTTVTYIAPLTFSSVIPLVSSMMGHVYVAENSNNISITGSTCNTVPATQSRFVLISGSSHDISTRDLRLIQQTLPNPDYWMEVGPPGFGQTASNRIHLECGDITNSQVLIASGATNVIKWFSDIYQLPNITMLSNGLLNFNNDVGISRNGAGTLAVGNGTQGDVSGSVEAAAFLIVNGGHGYFASDFFRLRSTGQMGFAPSNDATANSDIAISRDSAGVLAVGNGTTGDTSGTIKCATVIEPLTTPASSSATGTTGQIVWDAGFIYVCTATNTWKRAALSTF